MENKDKLLKEKFDVRLPERVMGMLHGVKGTVQSIENMMKQRVKHKMGVTRCQFVLSWDSLRNIIGSVLHYLRYQTGANFT